MLQRIFQLPFRADPHCNAGIWKPITRVSTPQLRLWQESSSAIELGRLNDVLQQTKEFLTGCYITSYADVLTLLR
jgi:hypothetical protein